ncbi:MAG TPA: SPFH domain-containing protein [Gaiellaceae bacterium]|jgi:regulator of protease activity HflC (stomatin/prohibitin superfamily)
MAEIRTYPFVRHLRSESTTQTLHYRRGELVRSGVGLSFWFRPLVTAVSEIPVDDRDIDFHLQSSSSDFQAVDFIGSVTIRVVDPVLLARRVDFAIDLETGAWLRAPLKRLHTTVVGLVQQLEWEYVSNTALKTLLAEGIEESRRRIAEALASEQQLADLGITVVSVHIGALRPSAETEKALEMPTRERIQQEADEATFQRRALAVEKERAIQENELQNQIELAKREEQLVVQNGSNHRRAVEEEAVAARIAADSAAATTGIEAEAEARRIGLVRGAAGAIERERAELLASLSPVTTFALVLQDAAGALPEIGQLVISPDLLTSLAARLTVQDRSDGHGE